MNSDSNPTAHPDVFYHERVPAQFNRTFDAQRARAEAGDADAARVLEGMKAVNSTIEVQVDGAELALSTGQPGFVAGSTSALVLKRSA